MEDHRLHFLDVGSVQRCAHASEMVTLVMAAEKDAQRLQAFPKRLAG